MGGHGKRGAGVIADVKVLEASSGEKMFRRTVVSMALELGATA